MSTETAVDRVKIDINTASRFRPLRALYASATQVAVIGVGVLTGSAAMQWCGFLVLALLWLVIAKQIVSRNEGLTFDEARARINELENEER